MVLHQQNHATENGAGSGWTGVNIIDKNYEMKNSHLYQVLSFLSVLFLGPIWRFFLYLEIAKPGAQNSPII
jgi:hypothetical protein